MDMRWMNHLDELKKRRRYLRHNLTPTELRVWEKLKDRRFYGYRWRRQQSIAEFIADYYCAEAKVVFELDGPPHNDPERKKRDEEKTRRFEQLGIKVIRFKNPRIYYDWKKVAAVLLAELRKRCPDPGKKKSSATPSLDAS